MGASARHAIHVKYGDRRGTADWAARASPPRPSGNIDPEMAYWTTSGEFIFITYPRGHRQRHRAVPRRARLRRHQTVAFGISPNTWQMVLGGSLLVVIVFLPNGCGRCSAGASWLEMAAILDAQGLNKNFGAAPRRATSTPPSKGIPWWALIGTNGAGKTTFINHDTGFSSRPRAHPLRGPRHHELAPRDVTRTGHLPLVPDPAPLRLAHRVREHAGGIGVVLRNAAAADSSRAAGAGAGHDLRRKMSPSGILERFGLADVPRQERAGAAGRSPGSCSISRSPMVAKPRFCCLTEPPAACARKSS